MIIYYQVIVKPYSKLTIPRHSYQENYFATLSNSYRYISPKGKGLAQVTFTFNYMQVTFILSVMSARVPALNK